MRVTFGADGDMGLVGIQGGVSPGGNAAEGLLGATKALTGIDGLIAGDLSDVVSIKSGAGSLASLPSVKGPQTGWTR